MDQVLKIIKAVKALVNCSEIINETDGELINFIEKNFDGVISQEVKNIFTNTSKLHEDVNSIFMGFDPLSLKDIAEQYRNPCNSLFFKGFNIDERFIAGHEASLRIFTNLQGEVEDQIIVDDLKRVLPLFDGSAGYYICLFVNEEGETEIATITQDYGICSLAPSILDHLSNLEDGLTRGVFYYVEDEGLIYPSSWYQRLQALSPKGLDKDKWDC